MSAQKAVKQAATTNPQKPKSRPNERIRRLMELVRELAEVEDLVAKHDAASPAPASQK